MSVEPVRPEQAIARIILADGRPVGQAFVVARRHLVTCAHVVNLALNRPLRDMAPPGEVRVLVDFPFGGDRGEYPVRSATVQTWLPSRLTAAGFDECDVASLLIGEALPAGVPVLALDLKPVDGSVQMWGPVANFAAGGHVVGRLLGGADKSRLQVDQSSLGAFRVAKGFSGGPAWRRRSRRVVGLVQAVGPGDEALDMYVLRADLIAEAVPELLSARDGAAEQTSGAAGVPVAVPKEPEQARAITILHLARTAFERPAMNDPVMGGHERARRLVADLESLDTRPDLVVVAGDLARSAAPAEYENAYAFLDHLRAGLALDSARLVVVPGDHDVNRKKCQAYFLDREVDDAEPVRPYGPKWDPFAMFFGRLYGTLFAKDEPWLYVELPELHVAVAGLNSTMAISHRESERYGWLGDDQLSWFARKLAEEPIQGMLRIGVVYHDPGGNGQPGSRGLRDAAGFAEMLAPRLDLVLHGQPGRRRRSGSSPTGPPTLAAAAAAAAAGAGDRSEAGERYQLVEIRSDVLRLRTRWSASPEGGWSGAPVEEIPRPPIEPTPAARGRRQPVGATPERSDVAVDNPLGSRGLSDPDGDELLQRVEEVTRLRLPDAIIKQVLQPGDMPYLRVTASRTTEPASGVPAEFEQFPIGVCEGDITAGKIDRFASRVGERFHRNGAAWSKLVYDGRPADPALRSLAAERRVQLLSFMEYQFGYDLRPYTERLARELAVDQVYPSGLYVPQRYWEIGPDGKTIGDRGPREDLLGQLGHWLTESSGQLTVVLGQSGIGKTFLLRELTRRMHADPNPAVPVPVLVGMRDLEKTHRLDEMVAAHLAGRGETRIDLKMFGYLVREGRVALLFDGFEELAVRVTYDRAAEHLATIVRAAHGRAKIVLTSRDQHFLTDAQVLSALGDRLSSVIGRRLVRLASFDEEQIAAFLTKRVGEAAAKRRLTLLHQVRDLPGVCRNPRMLHFVSHIKEDLLIAAQQGTAGITAASLYRDLVGQWLKHELDRLQALGVEPMPSVEQLWYAVTDLALRLWRSSEASLGTKDLGEIAQTLAEIAVPAVTAQPSARDRRETEHLIGAALLVRDDEGRFTFVHQSVIEWLVAQHVATRLDAGDPMPEPLRYEMSPLMVEFVCMLAAGTARSWTENVLANVQSPPGAADNALRIHRQLGIAATTPMRLSGRDLRGEDLSGSELPGANLAGGNLTEAMLVGANLAGADLTNAKLIRCCLNDAQLTDAVLRDADLSGARLLGADLTGADLAGAHMRRTALLGAKVTARSLAAVADAWGSALPQDRPPPPQFGPKVTSTRAIAVDPRGELLASGGENGAVRLWDIASGALVRQISSHGGPVLSISFSSDGRWLASGSDDGVVRVWQTDTGVLLQELTGEAKAVPSVAFSPDGRFLAGGDDKGRVRLWGVGDFAPLREIGGHAGAVLSVAFSADGRLLVSGGRDNGIRMVRPDTGEPARPALTGDWGAVWSVAFSPDSSLLAAATEDGSVRVWEPGGVLVRQAPGHTGAALAVAFSAAGGRLASGGRDRTVRVSDVSTGESLHTCRGPVGAVWSVTFSPDGSWVAGAGDDGSVRLWETHSGSLRGQLSGQTGEVLAVTFSPDGRRLASGGRDRLVRLWDVRTGALQRQYAGHGGAVWRLAFSPDGSTLASGGGDGEVRVWRDGTTLLRLAGPDSDVWSVAWSPDGTRLATGSGRVVRLWDARDGAMVRQLPALTGAVLSVTFSPDGDLLGVGGDGTVRLYPASGGDLASRQLTGTTEWVWSVVFSPDGRLLANSGGDGTVRIWDVHRAELLYPRPLRGHVGAVWSVAFSPDNRWLASAGDDGIVRVWRVEDGTLARESPAHSDWVRSLAFSPDGRWLASGSDDGTVRLWDWQSFDETVTLVALADGGWAALIGTSAYKLDGTPSGEFWYTVGACRFEPGELDRYFGNKLSRIDIDTPL